MTVQVVFHYHDAGGSISQKLHFAEDRKSEELQDRKSEGARAPLPHPTPTHTYFFRI